MQASMINTYVMIDGRKVLLIWTCYRHCLIDPRIDLNFERTHVGQKEPFPYIILWIRLLLHMYDHEMYDIMKQNIISITDKQSKNKQKTRSLKLG